ncbi:unnamed protein product [Timema podura]|uniref:Uncharacterized protein n=1 Tax=Timema podura TaxID=61482 RepID=A0ABN7NTR9_TIMPD|nr:unnamed protein product [Timema podura]
MNWKYTTVPDNRSCNGVGCFWAGGKVLGGSKKQGKIVWRYKDVIPSFKKSEDNNDIGIMDSKYHEFAGPLKVEQFRYSDENAIGILKAFKEMGYKEADFNREQQGVVWKAQYTLHKGKR